MELSAQKIAIGYLALIVISCLNFPRYFIDVFSIPFVHLGHRLPYFGPFCLLLLCCLLFVMLTERGGRVWVEKEELFLVMTLLSWLTLEWWHGGQTGRMNFEIIIGNIWLLIFYYLLKAHETYFGFTPLIVDVTIAMIAFISIFHLVSMLAVEYFRIFPFSLINTAELFQRNGVAFMAVLGSYLLLFYWKSERDVRQIVYPIVFFIFWLVVVFNESKGAILVFCVLILLKVAYSKIIYAKVCVMLVGLVGVILAGNIWQVYEWAQEVWGMVSRLVEGNELDRLQLYETQDDQVSAYSRIGSNIYMLQTFLIFPFLGVGLEQVFQVRVAGYISHSYYLFPLVAYGLIGLIPYLFFYGEIIKKGWRSMPQRAFATIVFVLGVMTFMNDLLFWYAIVLRLVVNDKSYEYHLSRP